MLRLSFSSTKDFSRLVETLRSLCLAHTVYGRSTKSGEADVGTSRPIGASQQLASSRLTPMRHRPYPPQRPSTSQGFVGPVMRPPSVLHRPGSAMENQPQLSLPNIGISPTPIPFPPRMRESEDYWQFSPSEIASRPSQPRRASSPSTTSMLTSESGGAGSHRTSPYWSMSQTILSSTLSDVSVGTSREVQDWPPLHRNHPFNVDKPRHEGMTGNEQAAQGEIRRGDPDEISSPRRGGLRSLQKPSHAVWRAPLGNIDPQITAGQSNKMRIGDKTTKVNFPSKPSKGLDPILVETREVGDQARAAGPYITPAPVPVSVDRGTQSEKATTDGNFAILSKTAALIDTFPDIWSKSIDECVDAFEGSVDLSREGLLRIALARGCRLLEEISKACEEARLS